MTEFLGEKQNAKSDLMMATEATLKIWRKYHLTYEQTKRLVEEVRKKLNLKMKNKKSGVVNRLSKEEAHLLIEQAYRGDGKYGLLVKVLFFTGARVNEFVNIKVEDILFEDNEILIAHGKGNKKRYVPIMPSMSHEIRSYLNGRKIGYLFESIRNTKYSPRRIQQIIKECAQKAGITKPVYPHLLRHSVATILRQKGMPLDLIQKFLGHSNIETTQIYSEAPSDLLKEIYKDSLYDLS